MAKLFTRPRGTQDVLPQDSWKWQAVEKIMRDVVHLFGYTEMRVPTFEATEVFSRGVGETTDIVSKEMYTFEDKGGRSITLRPEGTAGFVRSVLENGLLSANPLPLKYYYLQSCFRYEKAQKGRLREFHQLGIECFGTHAPEADAEAIAVGAALIEAFGITEEVTLEINSIGCPVCRPGYHKELKKYFESYKDQLCDTCIERLETNPMRILDCKEKCCHEIAMKAPVMLDYLCEDCDTHFTSVKSMLDGLFIAYVINPHIVRGLDYYTNTVFEFIAEGVGTQGTVCAGGRYDGLVQELGGAETPAIGFGMGVERILLAMEAAGTLPQPPKGPLMYAVGADEKGREAARALVSCLRQGGLSAEYDISNRSVKAQMKHANRLGAVFTTVLGSNEAESGSAVVKRMSDGTEWTMAIDEISELLYSEPEISEE